MQTIIKYLVLSVLCFITQSIYAQDDGVIKEGNIPYQANGLQIDRLIENKKIVTEQEKELLKSEVETIDQRLDKHEISIEEAVKLKKEMAEKRALNIKNKVAIIDNKIELLKRNTDNNILEDEEVGFTISIGNDSESEKKSFRIGRKNTKKIKYDRRTTSDMVLAFGFNNALADGEKLDDSPYKFAGSRFFELGWAWKTRVFKENNFMRLKYGFSFQFNGLKPTNNRYFIQNGNVTTLEEFPSELNKSKLTITNLVVPIHFEFGPSVKKEKDTYFRYSTHNKFKIGIGGYAGFNIGTRQKLKYSVDGERVKDKIKRDYNASGLVYGLSSYIAFDDIALYAKYDLSPIFKDQAIKQNNISLGVRFDMD